MKSFSWHTHEYIYREKKSDWFWVVGIISVGIAITSIIFGNLIFAVLILIGAFTLSLMAARKPHVVEVGINEKTVTVGRETYSYSDLQSFWIDETHPDGNKLVLRLKKSVFPYIIMPITHDDVDSVRGFLETKLKAEPYKEKQIQILFERLGF